MIIGGYSLEVLQEHAIKSFSDIPSKGLKSSWDIVPESPFKDAGMPLTEKSLGKIFYMAPVRDRHSLSVTWQIPPQLGNWKSKPGDYLAHLIGHEAQGSLLAALKAKSWVTACCAGIGAEGYEVRAFAVLFHIEHDIPSSILISCFCCYRMPRHTPCSSSHLPCRKKASPIGATLCPCCINT